MEAEAEAKIVGLWEMFLFWRVCNYQFTVMREVFPFSGNLCLSHTGMAVRATCVQGCKLNVPISER